MHIVSKLKNGITLIKVPVKGTRATTVLVMFPVGSRYETKKISGASHFVEHMMFKGTKKRLNAQDISRTLEAVGADYNAFTFKDYTGYYVKIDGTKQEMAFDLLSDMVFHSVIKAEEAEKEKGAIVEELRMYQDNPIMDIDILADKLVFGDHPLGWDVGGTSETVRGISREELWAHYQRHYTPKNMVLVVAGNINSKNSKKFLQYFEKEENHKGAVALNFYKQNLKEFSWPSKELPLEKRVAVKEKKVDQAHVMLSFPSLPQHHPNRFALSLLLTILGGGMSSRLFVEVRERRGLAYMVRTGATAYRDVGVCYVQAGLDPARLPEAIKVIKTELAKIVKSGITPKELADAISNSSGRMALGMEDSSAQADWFAKQFLFATKIQTPEFFIKELNKVTIKDVNNIAKKILQWPKMRLAVIGPLSKEKVMRILRKDI